jgi:hypothetical protein
MSILAIQYTFSPNTEAFSAQVNANFAAVVASVNNIDNTNIGVLGLYASQMIPTSTAQATFGGTTPYYTFNNGVTINGGGGGSTALGVAQIAATGQPTVAVVAPISPNADMLRVGAGAGTGRQFAVDLNGNTNVLGPSLIVASGAAAGQMLFGSTSATQGRVAWDGTNYNFYNASGAAITAQIVNTGAIVPGRNSVLGTSAIYSGTGAPSFSAPNGSVFLRYDGGANAHMYLNTSGASSSGTTWTAVTD